MPAKKKAPTQIERIEKLEKEFADIKRILKRVEDILKQMDKTLSIIIKKDLDEIDTINEQMNAPIISR